MRVRVPRGWRAGLVATLLLVGVTCLDLALGRSTAGAVLVLACLPVALLGLSFGPRGAWTGAAAGLALDAVLALTGKHGVGLAAFLPTGVALLVVGGLAAALWDERARRGAADSRWFEMANDMLVEVSLDGYFTRLGAQWERCLGWTREELMSRPFREFVHPDDLVATNVHADALEDAPGEVVNFENRYLAKDGSWRWLAWCARSDHDRKYGVARDITDRKRLEEERQALLDEMGTMARTDALTGLPNRRCWDEEVGRAITRARRHGRPLALAMVDLDSFKQYNDTHGHAAGDLLLAEAAAGWRRVLRTTDFLARYGGEEFAVLLPDCARGEAENLLERLRGAMPERQTCSVGLAHLDAADEPDGLVARADTALYEAKRQGRDRVVIAA